MRYRLRFSADEEAWTALPEAERSAAIVRIGLWFGEPARARKIVEGPNSPAAGGDHPVRLGRIQRSGDLPIVTDSPFTEAKKAVGSYGVVEVADRAEAIAIAIPRRWPAGGIVELRPVDAAG